MRNLKIFVLMAIGIVIIIALLMGIRNNSHTEELTHSEKVYVKTSSVLQKKIAVPIRCSGRLASKSETKLSFKIGGIIANILVDEGDKVKKGQLLAKLNQAEIQAQVTQARSGLEKARRDLERAQKLYADSVATLEQLQDATTAMEIGASNLKIAEFNLQHAAINAPSDGIILKRFAESNELIDAGTPVFIFGTSEKDWIVRVGVTDQDVLRIQLNDSASVVLDAYPNRTFSSYVSEIAEAADPMSGTFEIELKIQNKDVVLKSGFIATATIVPADKKSYHIVPIEALIECDGYDGYVFKLNDDQTMALKTPVKIGSIGENEILIVDGLEHIKHIITEGAPYLSDSTLVEILNE